MFIENRSLPTIPKSEKKTDNDCLSAIKCLCGEIILVVPNIKLMSKAIETHVEKHLQEVTDPKEAEAIAEHIRADLIIQVLEKASKN
jgi:ABC-type sulfate transport system permease subunit